MVREGIHFFTEGISYQIREKQALRKIIGKIILESDFIPGPINIIFCSDKFLRRYNKKYLRHDYYTDVIAFDLSGEAGIIEGDIYISLERIRQNARQYHVAIQKEISRVIIHGILHLVGFEDGNREAKREMEKAENSFMSKMVNDSE